MHRTRGRVIRVSNAVPLDGVISFRLKGWNCGRAVYAFRLVVVDAGHHVRVRMHSRTRAWMRIRASADSASLNSASLNSASLNSRCAEAYEGQGGGSRHEGADS